MDFMQLLRSLQEMLYEVMSWLVFYPKTLVQTLRNPAAITALSDRELGEKPEEQYTDIVQPPLFLLLSILLAFGLEQITGARSPELTDGGWFKDIAASSQNLLIYRAFISSVLPLIAAVEYLTRRKVPLERASLKAPFYSQCYLAGAFVLAFGAGQAFAGIADPRVAYPAALFGIATLVWYAAAVTGWFHRALATSWVRAGLVSAKVLALAFLTHMTISSLLSLKQG